MLFRSAVLLWSLALMRTSNETRNTKLVASGRLDPTIFATHHYALGDTMIAYDTFADAPNTNALKVVLDGSESNHNSDVLALAASTS